MCDFCLRYIPPSVLGRCWFRLRNGSWPVEHWQSPKLIWKPWDHRLAQMNLENGHWNGCVCMLVDNVWTVLFCCSNCIMIRAWEHCDFHAGGCAGWFTQSKDVSWLRGISSSVWSSLTAGETAVWPASHCQSAGQKGRRTLPQRCICC